MKFLRCGIGGYCESARDEGRCSHDVTPSVQLESRLLLCFLSKRGGVREQASNNTDCEFCWRYAAVMPHEPFTLQRKSSEQPPARPPQTHHGWHSSGTAYAFGFNDEHSSR